MKRRQGENQTQRSDAEMGDKEIENLNLLDDVLFVAAVRFSVDRDNKGAASSRADSQRLLI